MEKLIVASAKPKIDKTTRKVFDIISSKWPSNPFEVGTLLGDSGSQKTLSAKYLYHFKKLRRLELINMKKVGNTYIAWPVEMEKLRFIHEMLRE